MVVVMYWCRIGMQWESIKWGRPSSGLLVADRKRSTTLGGTFGVRKNNVCSPLRVIGGMVGIGL